MEDFNTSELINLPEHITNSLIRLENKLDSIWQSSTILNKQVLDIDEASELLNMSKYTLYTKTSKGEVPFYKEGRKIYFKRDELLEHITRKENRYKSNAEIETEAATHVITKGRG